MPTGDSLTVLLFLTGTSLAAMIGAVTAPSGWRSKTLWWMAALFGISALAWLILPAANPLIEILGPVASAMIDSGFMIIVFTVGIVALMVGRRDPPNLAPVDFAHINPEPKRRLPKFAVPPSTKWTPDLTFSEGLGYLGAKSIWRSRYGNTVNAGTDELKSALAASKITAWGREHPGEGELFQIAQVFWNRTEITLSTDYAFSHVKSVGAYDVHLCQDEMKQVWPPTE